jgi:hypothetical protein
MNGIIGIPRAPAGSDTNVRASGRSRAMKMPRVPCRSRALPPVEHRAGERKALQLTGDAYAVGEQRSGEVPRGRRRDREGETHPTLVDGEP